jgi:sarcosine oxidase subunit beta
VSARETCDVVVVGAGITGAAAAYELAGEGLSVLVLERYGPAAMASGWTLGGVRQSGRHPAELPLAKAAVARWASLDEELGAPTYYRRTGNLRLARTEQEAETIRALVEAQTRAGLTLEFLPTTAEVRALAPAVSERALCASYCPTDGAADGAAATAAFLAAAKRRGVDIAYGERVVSIRAEKGRVVGVATQAREIAAARVVVAAGVFGHELLAPLGVGVPLATTMVTVLRSAPLPPTLAQVIGVANADCAGRQQHDGRLRFTSGVTDWHGRWRDEAGADGAMRPCVGATAASVEQVARLFGEVVPAAGTAELEAFWSGLIDLTPDGLPVLDAPAAMEGLVIAMGFSGHGFCLGPVSGAIIRDLTLGRISPFDLTPFAQNRFSGQSARREATTLHG